MFNLLKLLGFFRQSDDERKRLIDEARSQGYRDGYDNGLVDGMKDDLGAFQVSHFDEPPRDLRLAIFWAAETIKKDRPVAGDRKRVYDFAQRILKEVEPYRSVGTMLYCLCDTHHIAFIAFGFKPQLIAKIDLPYGI